MRININSCSCNLERLGYFFMYVSSVCLFGVHGRKISKITYVHQSRELIHRSIYCFIQGITRQDWLNVTKFDVRCNLCQSRNFQMNSNIIFPTFIKCIKVPHWCHLRHEFWITKLFFLKYFRLVNTLLERLLFAMLSKIFIA